MIELPYYKQDTTYSCGAASVQMLLRYHGQIVAEHTLMKLMQTDTDYGTHHEAIIELLTEHGLYCYVNTESSYEELTYYLELGFPVLLHYIEPSSDEHHYAIAVGEEHDRLVLHDPWNGPHFQIVRDEFLSRWHDKDNRFPQWLLVTSDTPFELGRQYLAK